MPTRIEAIQSALCEANLDGWLFFDHHRRDSICYRVLQFVPGSIVSRRWFYFVPAQGEPRGLVHQIEANTLASLPGLFVGYSGWDTLLEGLRSMLKGTHRIAMQYSPDCAIPYVAMVDAGTIELVRGLGVEVVTSADLVQLFEARWTPHQLEMHLEAGRRIDKIRAQAFARISAKLHAHERVTEWETAEFIRDRFADEGLVTDHGPDVAVNANASNPHYEPKPDSCSEVKPGDSVLIDMWAKLNQPGAVYYDITWVGYCRSQQGTSPPDKFQNIFNIVREARDRAIQRVVDAVSKKQMLRGFEVDDAARQYIREKGFADYFFHRTGHSIGEEVHGTGANMDNLETHDERRIIPQTCFSVEPGIYLPEMGVRLEVDVFVEENKAFVTGEIQRELVLI